MYYCTLPAQSQLHWSVHHFIFRFLGNWKPIIPPVKIHQAQSVIEPQPLLYHQASNLDSHPAQFHVVIERFPGPDESHSPSKVTFGSGPSSAPWGEDSGSYSGGSSSGSSESSEEQGGGNFYHGKCVKKYFLYCFQYIVII